MEKQMDPSDVVDFGSFIGEDNCAIGIVQCQKGCTYDDIHCEIANDEVVEYPFDFIIGSTGYPICPSFPTSYTSNTRKCPLL